MALDEELEVLREYALKLVHALWFVNIYRWSETDPVELFDDPPFQKTILAHLHDLHESVEQLSKHLRNVQLRDLLIQATPTPVTHAGRHGVTCCDLLLKIGEALTGQVVYFYADSPLASVMKGGLDGDDTDLLDKAWHQARSVYAKEPLVTSREDGIDDGKLGAMVESEIREAGRLLRAAEPLPPDGDDIVLDKQPAPGAKERDYVGAKELSDGEHGPCPYKTDYLLRGFLDTNIKTIHQYRKGRSRRVHLAQFKTAIKPIMAAVKVKKDGSKGDEAATVSVDVVESIVEEALDREQRKRNLAARSDEGGATSPSINDLGLDPATLEILHREQIQTVSHLKEMFPRPVASFDGMTPERMDELYSTIALHDDQ